MTPTDVTAVTGSDYYEVYNLFVSAGLNPNNYPAFGASASSVAPAQAKTRKP